MIRVLAWLMLIAPLQEPTEREVRTLVLAYVDAKDEGKAKEAMDRLRSVRPILAQKTLKSILGEGKPARTAKVVDLALELGVPGLWDALSKQIDGPDEERIVKLVFQTQEPAALTALIQRWSKADTSSASFKFLESAMKSYGVADPKHLDTLKSFVAFNDSIRAESASSILCAQLGVSSKDELIQNYDALKTEFLAYGKQPQIPGADLAGFIKHRGAWRLGANLKVQDGSTVEIEKLPAFLQTGALTFSFEVFPVEGALEVNFLSDSKGESRTFKIQLDAKDWYVRTGDGKLLTVPARFKTWNKMEFVLFPYTQKEAGHPCSRHAHIIIGGKTLLDEGCLTGEWSGIKVECKGIAYLGGFSALKR